MTVYGGNNENNIELEDINISSNQLGSGNSNKVLQNTRCIFKISETNLFLGGNEFERIPDLFYELKYLLIIKNNDKKCFLYCYIN